MKPLGEHIRQLREKLDISGRELAKKIKVSAPFLSDVELGRRHPSEEVLKAIAAALSTTVEDLRQHDARPPIQELKRIAANNPAMGFALRRVVDGDVNPDDLLAFLEQRGRTKKP